MRRLRLTALLATASLAAGSLFAAERKQRKKAEKEEVTQTLEVPPDPPPAVVADSSRLVFHVSALSAKGLLSQQVRDALRDLRRQARGAAIVKLRAFVAGSGDMRRVQAIVSETFAGRRQALPALSVVQVGGLPLTGAQVVLESVAVARKTVNPAGLAFVSGQLERSDSPQDQVVPLVSKSLAGLSLAVRAAGAESADVARVTCFVTSLADVNTVRAAVARAFPKAVWNVLQVRRASLGALAECEAVARLRTTPDARVKMLNPAGLPASPYYSQVALIAPGRLALSGMQMAFGYQDQDLQLAFQRLSKALDSVGAKISDTAVSNIYPLSERMSGQIRAVRRQFYDSASPPAATMLAFEGLPSLDATCGVDVIALVN